jgi:hypothetical protein
VGNRSYIYMTSSNIYEKNGKKWGRTTLSKIVIEVDGLGESETRMRLIVDTHLVAKNLTGAQMKLLLGEILERIAVFEGEKEPESIEGQLH